MLTLEMGGGNCCQHLDSPPKHETFDPGTLSLFSDYKVPCKVYVYMNGMEDINIVYKHFINLILGENCGDIGDIY